MTALQKLAGTAATVLANPTERTLKEAVHAARKVPASEMIAGGDLHLAVALRSLLLALADAGPASRVELLAAVAAIARVSPAYVEASDTECRVWWSDRDN